MWCRYIGDIVTPAPLPPSWELMPKPGVEVGEEVGYDCFIHPKRKTKKNASLLTEKQTLPVWAVLKNFKEGKRRL